MKIQTVICLCCSAVMLLCGCRQNRDSSMAESTTAAAETAGADQTDTAAVSADAPAVASAALPVQRSEPVRIRVSGGSADLKKPAKLRESDVFTGFAEKETISQIGDAADGTEFTLTPECISVLDLQNTVYANAVYVSHEPGTEFSVPVVIGGKTDFSLLELEISYDSAAFEFTGITDTDGDAVCNHVPADSTVYLSFISPENVQADVGLCTLNFRTGTGGKLSSALEFRVRDIARWNTDCTAYESVPCETAGGSIVTY